MKIHIMQSFSEIRLFFPFDETIAATSVNFAKNFDIVTWNF